MNLRLPVAPDLTTLSATEALAQMADGRLNVTGFGLCLP